MVAFANAFGWTPREFDEIYIPEIWPLLDALEAGASSSGTVSGLGVNALFGE